MDTIFDFKNFTYQQSQFVNADGAVIKLGAILQPVEWLRLGLSYESPTWYTVSDDYQTKIDANYDSVPVFSTAASPLFTPFTYRYNKPGRITAGMAFLFGATASLSIDYDYINYSNMKVEALNDVFAEQWAANLNNTVRSTFKSTSNVRIGGEYIYGPMAFRAGFAYWGSPYQRGVNTGGADYSRLDYTAGAGIKLGKVGVDLSVVHNRTKGYWLPYYIDGRTTYDVQFRNYQTMVQATMSFRLD
jgi:long-subunit fatty acid transport protein